LPSSSRELQESAWFSAPSCWSGCGHRRAGAVAIAKQPAILAAFNPLYGAGFLVQAGLREAVLLLSVLILVVTGGEAMYADLGHSAPGRSGSVGSRWCFPRCC